MDSNIFADIDNTNNPFKIAQFIFERLEPNDTVYFSNSDDVSDWYYKYKITDIVYDTDTKNNKRRSFILSKKIEADNKPDYGFCGYKSMKDYLARNKVPFYRFYIVRALTDGKTVSIYSNNSKVCFFTINVEQYFKDVGYIRSYKNTPDYSNYDVIEDTTNSLRHIVSYLKDSREGYLDELLDLQSMIDYYFLTSYYNNLRGVYLCDLVKQYSGEFHFIWNINTKKYTGNTEIDNATDIDNVTANEAISTDNYKAASNVDKDKEISKEKKYSAVHPLIKTIIFNIGDIVIDYNGNYGYISKIISTNIRPSVKNPAFVYRYKWQPLSFESNEIDLKTPISLYYKRVGSHVFITDENTEYVKKRRETLQEAAQLWKEFKGELEENINKRTENFLKNNDSKAIEYAMKVSEQIKNINKNVKISADNKASNDDNNGFGNEKSLFHTFDSEKFPYLRNYINNTNINTKPDIQPTLPKKLDFDSSEYDVTSTGHYNEKKEDALCNTINDIIDYLDYLSCL